MSVEKCENYPYIQCLSAITSDFLWRLTGNTRRCELDLDGYGGVLCPLGLHYNSVSSELWCKPPALTSSLQPVVISQMFIRNMINISVIFSSFDMLCYNYCTFFCTDLLHQKPKCCSAAEVGVAQKILLVSLNDFCGVVQL